MVKSTAVMSDAVFPSSDWVWPFDVFCVWPLVSTSVRFLLDV